MLESTGPDPQQQASAPISVPKFSAFPGLVSTHQTSLWSWNSSQQGRQLRRGEATLPTYIPCLKSPCAVSIFPPFLTSQRFTLFGCYQNQAYIWEACWLTPKAILCRDVLLPYGCGLPSTLTLWWCLVHETAAISQMINSEEKIIISGATLHHFNFYWIYTSIFLYLSWLLLP